MVVVGWGVGTIFACDGEKKKEEIVKKGDISLLVCEE